MEESSVDVEEERVRCDCACLSQERVEPRRPIVERAYVESRGFADLYLEKVKVSSD